MQIPDTGIANKQTITVLFTAASLLTRTIVLNEEHERTLVGKTLEFRPSVVFGELRSFRVRSMPLKYGGNVRNNLATESLKVLRSS